jgi:vacuolar protein sorting-associated protein 13A/C
LLNRIQLQLVLQLSCIFFQLNIEANFVLQVNIICLGGDLTVKMKLHSLKIKDELQGRLSSCPQYLACSVQKNDESSASTGPFDPHAREMSIVLPEDDEIFKDALPDFMSLSETGIYSQNMDIAHCGMMGNINDPGFESSEAFSHGNDLAKGKGISGEIFYEAEGTDNSDFVSVNFLTRSSGSRYYNGVDTQVPKPSILHFKSRPNNIYLLH